MKNAIIAAIAVLAFAGTAGAGPLVNPNSIVVDDVEYYVQTDKYLYDLGEYVEMLYRVTNLGTEDVTFTFPHRPEWNFWVEKDGVEIWVATEGWTQMGSQFTLGPDEFKEFPDTNTPSIWDMRNKQNNLVDVGEYDVMGWLYDGMGGYDYTEVSVPIQIVPEPATILLLSVGIIGIRRKRYNKLCRS